MYLVKLCEGKRVRDPESKKLLEMDKPLKIERISAYWKRREIDGEVVIEKAGQKIEKVMEVKEKKEKKDKNN